MYLMLLGASFNKSLSVTMFLGPPYKKFIVINNNRHNTAIIKRQIEANKRYLCIFYQPHKSEIMKYVKAILISFIIPKPNSSGYDE